MVPIREGDPLGAIGAYWAVRHQASDDEVARLRQLATAAGRGIERLEPVTA